MITAAQCRAGRALLQWKMADLADKSGVSVSTINSFELGQRQPTKPNTDAMQRALEAAGVRFTATGVEPRTE